MAESILKEQLKTYGLKRRERQSQILKWRNYSIGVFWIDASYLAVTYPTDDTKDIVLDFDDHPASLNDSIKTYAITSDSFMEGYQEDFRSFKLDYYDSRKFLQSKDASARLRCWGRDSEICAAQESGRLYPVEIFRPPKEQEDKLSSSDLKLLAIMESTVPSKPPALATCFNDLWSAPDEEFDVLLEGYLDRKTLKTHKKRLSHVLQNQGMKSRLKLLADECPFLWHGLELKSFSFLSLLVYCCPTALYNYLDHVLMFWRSEVLINGIQGASKSLTKAALKKASGAWPHISKKDSENLTDLSKLKISSTIITHLKKCKSRIITLGYFS